MQPAYTVNDARKLHASELKLSHRKLQALPEGLASLTMLSSIDASDNPISNVAPGALPATITSLTLTGCRLHAVPPCLTQLTGLQQLQLAANSITQANAALACPRLLHAGLSFNNLTSLSSGMHAADSSFNMPAASVSSQLAATQQSSSSSSPPRCNATPAELEGASQTDAGTRTSCSTAGSTALLARSPLMSLDLSHNDIIDLPAALAQLKQLSQLKSVSLKGNPASLMPGYRDTVLQHLPQLLYLDGQKLDGISTAPPGSRPGSNSNKRRPGSARPGSASAAARLCAAAPQQQPLTAAFSNLLAPAVPDQVPLLLFLELDKQQMAEASERAFAAIAAESARKQQQLLQEAGACSSSSGEGGSTSGSGLAAGSAATAGCSDAAQPAAPALKPVSYHMELEAADGTQLGSLPLVIQPPNVAAADKAAAAAAAVVAGATTDGKKAGGKGSRLSKQDSKMPAAAKPKPGSAVRGLAGKARPSMDDGSAGAGLAVGAVQLMQGGLQVLLKLPVTVAGRDWLRQGFHVKLIRTQQEPAGCAQPPPPAPGVGVPASSVAAGASGAGAKQAPSAGGKATGSKAGKQLAPSAPEAPAAAAVAAPVWQYELKQHLLGSAKVAAADLLDSCGQQQVSEGTAEFMPPAPLFDVANGTLLAVKEATRKQQPLGSCRFKLVLHCDQPVLGRQGNAA